MKIKRLFSYLMLSAILFSVAGCSEQTEPALAAPANSKAVLDFVKGKKLQVKKVGFFGNFTVNDIKDIEWLDASKEKDKTTKDAVTEEIEFALEFTNDTAVIVKKKGKTYPGTYAVDDKAGDTEGETPGIKLLISFTDPDFNMGFGDGAPMQVTYTYPVLGLDAKRIMLETPRSINRQKLISMMSE